MVLNEKSRCFWEFDKNNRAIREETVSASVLLTSCLIRQKKSPTDISLAFLSFPVHFYILFRQSQSLLSCKFKLTWSQQKESVSGLPHLHPSFILTPESGEFLHFQAFPLFFKDTAGAPPIKILQYFSFLFCLHIHRKMDVCPDFNFPFCSDVAETPLHNRDALSFLAFLSILLSSLRLLGERSRCPTANAYSRQSYRFSPDTGPSNAAVLSRAREIPEK